MVGSTMHSLDRCVPVWSITRFVPCAVMNAAPWWKHLPVGPQVKIKILTTDLESAPLAEPILQSKTNLRLDLCGWSARPLMLLWHSLSYLALYHGSVNCPLSPYQPHPQPALIIVWPPMGTMTQPVSKAGQIIVVNVPYRQRTGFSCSLDTDKSILRR